MLKCHQSPISVESWVSLKISLYSGVRQSEKEKEKERQGERKRERKTRPKLPFHEKSLSKLRREPPDRAGDVGGVVT